MGGEEGLHLIKKEIPDHVLLDLMLPGLDGIEVCRKLKADSATRSISVIMVTAKGEESDIVLGLGMGADDYVTKPFRSKELLARIKSVLRRGPLRDNLTQEQHRILNVFIALIWRGRGNWGAPDWGFLLSSTQPWRMGGSYLSRVSPEPEVPFKFRFRY